MGKTKRNKEGINFNPGAFRHPQTFNEMSQLEELLVDDDLDNYKISGLNRLKRRKRLPTAWDDEVISAYYEEDHA